ncbi:MAG: hypothetical protein EWM51_04315 [Treponema sp.]|nr:MAG: hypothetical protein EWM51_04315 [Treponema sp.]
MHTNTHQSTTRHGAAFLLCVAFLFTGTGCDLFTDSEKTESTVAAPVINPTEGLKASHPFDVSIYCSTPDSYIRYTTDGTDPTDSSEVYVKELELVPPVTVKAKAFKNGYIESPVATARFTPPPAIVINEILYDDFVSSGGREQLIDTQEFVELYNPGDTPVDITGYTIESYYFTSSANLGPQRIPYSMFTVGTGGASEEPIMLAGKDYYVLGVASTQNADQIISSDNQNCFYDNECVVELRDRSGILLDTLCYENQTSNPFGEYLEGGVFGKHQTTIFTSLSRYLDGRDTGRNGFDFGIKSATPGTANAIDTSQKFELPDIDAMEAGAEPAGFHGSYVRPRVIDPTKIDSGKNNPSVITASPQGGMALVAWDPTGGVNTTGTDRTYLHNSSFDLWVYLETTKIETGYETWDIGICGSEDGIGNTGDFRGTTGLAWNYYRDGDWPRLSLIYYAGTASTGSPIGEAITMFGNNPGWYRLSITIQDGVATASFGEGSNSITRTCEVDPNMIGNFYMSYKETFADLTKCRPPTIDAISPTD